MTPDRDRLHPLDDRLIARRADLGSRVRVTMVVRTANFRPALNQSLTKKRFAWALLYRYTIEWGLMLMFAAGLAVAIVESQR